MLIDYKELCFSAKLSYNIIGRKFKIFARGARRILNYPLTPLLPDSGKWAVAVQEFLLREALDLIFLVRRGKMSTSTI